MKRILTLKFCKKLCQLNKYLHLKYTQVLLKWYLRTTKKHYLSVILKNKTKHGCSLCDVSHRFLTVFGTACMTNKCSRNKQ